VVGTKAFVEPGRTEAGLFERLGHRITIEELHSEAVADPETQFDAMKTQFNAVWASAWYEQNGFEEEDFADAELLSKAKVTSVSGLVEAGILHWRGGKVRTSATPRWRFFARSVTCRWP
jgi:hypothetical protein